MEMLWLKALFSGVVGEALFSEFRDFDLCRGAKQNHSFSPRFSQEKLSERNLEKGMRRSRNHWREAPFHRMRPRHPANKGFGKEFYRRGASVKRSGPFSEPPDSENWFFYSLIPFPNLAHPLPKSRLLSSPKPCKIHQTHHPKQETHPSISHSRNLTPQKTERTNFCVAPRAIQ